MSIDLFGKFASNILLLTMLKILNFLNFKSTRKKLCKTPFSGKEVIDF
jgi:hypothetical protein